MGTIACRLRVDRKPKLPLSVWRSLAVQPTGISLVDVEIIDNFATELGVPPRKVWICFRRYIQPASETVH
jgi:hypothetical protein